MCLPLPIRGLVALLAVALCASLPGRAKAACGDWIEEHADPQTRVDLTTIPGRDVDAAPRENPGCDGPRCGQRFPLVPPTPAPAPVESSTDHLAWLAAVPDRADLGVNGSARPPDDRGETFRPFRPDRPPRA